MWGSGLEGGPLAALSCANIDVAADHVCPRPATAACSRCGLVAYCSKECQKQHWAAHKLDCKSSKVGISRGAPGRGATGWGVARRSASLRKQHGRRVAAGVKAPLAW